MDRHATREHRRSRRLLRQMDREAGRAAARARRRRAGPWRSLASLAAVVAVVVVGGVVGHETGWDGLGVLRPRVYVEIDGQAVAVPRAPASEGRVLPAVPVTTAGSHAFLHTTEDGSPVGYDPCRPVEYRVRPDGMPPSGEQLVADAVAIVSGATGLSLVDGGTTDEAPAVDRSLIQPDRYGEGWVPVLIAWSDETAVPELAGQVAGVGGSATVPGADGEGTWLAGGRLVLDTEDITALLARTDGYAQARAIVVHELAHVLGLDHVDDTGELMHPMTAHRSELGPGDRQGLALVGQVACEE